MVLMGKKRGQGAASLAGKCAVNQNNKTKTQAHHGREDFTKLVEPVQEISYSSPA